MKGIDRVEFVNQARAEFFSQPIFEKYTFKRAPLPEFWKIYENEFFKHFPQDLYFEEKKMRSEYETAKLNLLNDPQTDSKIEDNYLLIDSLSDSNDKVIAMVRGRQKSFDSYYMQFTAVHTDYRKQGIYSEIIDRVIGYTKLLGFCRVLSCHAPSNNPVIIAKLKKDFNIIGVDIDAALGINVWLCYFHNEDFKKAFELRCGNMSFSPRLATASLGTAEQLCKLISDVE